jgi:hypothetical protein
VAYQIALDIVNRAVQHLDGVQRIYALDEVSPAAREIAFAYDKIRDAELQRNAWRFAIKKAVLRAINNTTVIWTPAAYAATTTYAAGAVVSYTPATLNVSEYQANPVPYLWYASQAIAGSASNSPPDVSTSWHRYFGPVTCDPFVSDDDAPLAPTLGSTAAGTLAASTIYVALTYITSTGETLPSDESNLAVAVNHELVVTSPIAQTDATAYHVYAGLTSGELTLQTGAAAITIGTDWTEPSTGLVIGRRPPENVTGDTLPGFFAQEITLLGTTVYTSLVSGNIDAPPSGKWLAQGGTVAPLDILYPLGSGPRTDTRTMNLYRLPAGFLRKAPTDPMDNLSTYLGAPSGRAEEDWVFEGDYLTTWDQGPLLVRFVASMVDVYAFDPIFCEAFAARIATEIAGCPGVMDPDRVGSGRRNATMHYRDEISRAFRANSVIAGRNPKPLNPYITARL